MADEWREATEAGIKAAEDGLPITSCPYAKGERLRTPWKQGFRLVLPDSKTSIEDVFESFCGGPVRRKRIFRPPTAAEIEKKPHLRHVSVSGGVATNEWEVPAGAWYEPGNYEGQSFKGLKDDGKPIYEFGPTEWNKVFQEHLLSGGAYDVTDLPFLYLKRADTLGSAITSPGLAFVTEHGKNNIYIANGYQVMGIFLFAGKPKKLKDYEGSFGRGACAMFQNCPQRILLVAEDD